MKEKSMALSYESIISLGWTKFITKSKSYLKYYASAKAQLEPVRIYLEGLRQQKDSDKGIVYHQPCLSYTSLTLTKQIFKYYKTVSRLIWNNLGNLTIRKDH